MKVFPPARTLKKGLWYRRIPAQIRSAKLTRREGFKWHILTRRAKVLSVPPMGHISFISLTVAFSLWNLLALPIALLCPEISPAITGYFSLGLILGYYLIRAYYFRRMAEYFHLPIKKGTPFLDLWHQVAIWPRIVISSCLWSIIRATFFSVAIYLIVTGIPNVEKNALYAAFACLIVFRATSITPRRLVLPLCGSLLKQLKGTSSRDAIILFFGGDSTLIGYLCKGKSFVIMILILVVVRFLVSLLEFWWLPSPHSFDDIIVRWAYPRVTIFWVLAEICVAALFAQIALLGAKQDIVIAFRYLKRNGEI